jgi:hypothetical protein
VTVSQFEFVESVALLLSSNDKIHTTIFLINFCAKLFQRCRNCAVVPLYDITYSDKRSASSPVLAVAAADVAILLLLLIAIVVAEVDIYYYYYYK